MTLLPTNKEAVDTLEPLVEYWKAAKRHHPVDWRAEANALELYEEVPGEGHRRVGQVTAKQMEAIQELYEKHQWSMNHRGLFRSLRNLVGAVLFDLATRVHTAAFNLRVLSAPLSTKTLEAVIEDLDSFETYTLGQDGQGNTVHQLFVPQRTGVYLALCTQSRESLVRFGLSPREAIHLGAAGNSPPVWPTFMYVEVDTSSGRITKALGVGGERWSNVLAYHPSPTQGYPGFRKHHVEMGAGDDGRYKDT